MWSVIASDEARDARRDMELQEAQRALSDGFEAPLTKRDHAELATTLQQMRGALDLEKHRRTRRSEELHLDLGQAQMALAKDLKHLGPERRLSMQLQDVEVDQLSKQLEEANSKATAQERRAGELEAECAVQRRRCEALEARDRELHGRVQELSEELASCEEAVSSGTSARRPSTPRAATKYSDATTAPGAAVPTLELEGAAPEVSGEPVNPETAGPDGEWWKLCADLERAKEAAEARSQLLRRRRELKDTIDIMEAIRDMEQQRAPAGSTLRLESKTWGMQMTLQRVSDLHAAFDMEQSTVLDAVTECQRVQHLLMLSLDLDDGSKQGSWWGLFTCGGKRQKPMMPSGTAPARRGGGGLLC